MSYVHTWALLDTISGPLVLRLLCGVYVALVTQPGRLVVMYYLAFPSVYWVSVLLPLG